jgi:ketosteroid isomerase-like protein
MAHPHEEVLRKGTDALNRGDLETFLSLHADDLVTHIGGRSPFAGDYHGKEEGSRLIQRQMEMLDGPPVFDLHDVLANDTHGVILGTQRVTRGGKTFEDRNVVVFHFEDGKVKEVWVMPDDQAGEQEFWS